MSSFENPDGASHVLGTSFIDLSQKKRLDVPYTEVYFQAINGTQQTAKHRSEASRRFCTSLSLTRPTSFIDNHLLGLKRNVWTYPTQVYRNRIQVNKCEHSSLPDTSPTVGLDYLHGVCAQLVLKNRNSLTRPGGLIY